MKAQRQIALEIATLAHAGRKRKNGKPYINHSVRVEEIVNRDFTENYSYSDSEIENCRVAAFLHDVIEDCGYTVEKLIGAGINKEVANIVETLSCRKDENYFNFIMRINRHKLSSIVKLADLEDSMSDLPEGHLKDKYRFAKHILTIS